ncbi:MAG: glutathione peroxidase [Bacteroidetes bacterium]|nr:glutathione peroxidase [Bacteroidota bacterium]MBS1630684.1 glutathione peroxidase [Bacteroidota bacterium]
MFSLMLTLHCLLFFSPQASDKGGCAASIYDFKVAGLTGDSIDFAQFKGKKILIVNTASECGFTPQYEGLEKLYKANKDKLVIVGFPANNFGAQEPGTNQQIAHFCKQNYGVSFPMAAKISVKGDDMAPIYHWLTTKACNHHSNSSVKWNFQKYLINEQGQLVDVFYSIVRPESHAILKAINR